jgi:hypothetical protein
MILGCSLQAVTNLLEYKRTGLASKLWLGSASFILLGLGFCFLIVSQSFEAEVDRRTAIYVYKMCTVLGVLMWIGDLLFWLFHKVVIDNSKSTLARVYRLWR